MYIIFLFLKKNNAVHIILHLDFFPHLTQYLRAHVFWWPRMVLFQRGAVSPFLSLLYWSVSSLFPVFHDHEDLSPFFVHSKEPRFLEV